MMIMKRCMSRRTVLRGLGATVALPMLESMQGNQQVVSHPSRTGEAVDHYGGAIGDVPHGQRTTFIDLFGDLFGRRPAE